MVPRCTQALDKCKCVSWAQLQHKFDKIDTFIVFPCHLSYVRGGQRDVGPFSSPVNVATAYRTQWVLLSTHHNHVCPLAVLSSCTLEDVEWIWFHGLAKWSSCPISTQTWLAPLPKPFNPFIGIVTQNDSWGREEQSLNTFDVCEMPSTWFIFGVKAVVNDNYPFDFKREPDCEEWKCVIPILSNRVQSLCGLKNKIKR